MNVHKLKLNKFILDTEDKLSVLLDSNENIYNWKFKNDNGTLIVWISFKNGKVVDDVYFNSLDEKYSIDKFNEIMINSNDDFVCKLFKIGDLLDDLYYILCQDHEEDIRKKYLATINDYNKKIELFDHIRMSLKLNQPYHIKMNPIYSKKSYQDVDANNNAGTNMNPVFFDRYVGSHIMAVLDELLEMGNIIIVPFETTKINGFCSSDDHCDVRDDPGGHMLVTISYSPEFTCKGNWKISSIGNLNFLKN